ncbi:TonB-dependent receptor plug domain-containing protein [Phenylobacterium sp.]|jgi:outer membrane receptor protein involved in Fe transport|uniref:TonB-dependent receptor plug domain-containing protein n=1 Tax=Phenylobacterium sp. TaxID=1871053 RepID=UPI002E32CC10|nr:TonB-dependent receptor [Phenylobacterium sp.]HEX3367114.1 TonB-dependent receptor [Phenylobacterium sp.]
MTVFVGDGGRFVAKSRICWAGLAGCALFGATAALAQGETPKPAESPPSAAKPADQAKAAAPAKPAPKTHTVETITVTGAAAPQVETSIDKKTYTLGQDLQATTGSIADALRNVPAVEVDLQGNLSLRGDQNVTILVDGKPSPAFEGNGRADALQQLPADQIARVEVITNPSAALNPEGTGGVINLITKKSRGGGLTGSAYVTAASAGLKRAGVNFGYNTQTLAVTASFAGNYQRNKNHVANERDGLDAASGQFLKNFDDSIGRNLTRGPNGRVNFTWTPQDKDQFTGAISYNSLLVHGHPDDKYTDDGVGGVPVLIEDRSGRRRFLETDNSISAGWKHTFGEGHELSADAVYNDGLARDHTLNTVFATLPATPVPLELIRDDDSRHHEELRVVYTQKLAGGSLTAGYELRREDNDADYSDAKGPTQSGLILQPSLANHYLYGQLVNSLYATYQRSFGDLSVQAGLRAEDVRFTLAQLTSGERDGQHYERAYPTLHLNYKLDDERKLTASYSVRVQRPLPVFLDPLVYVLGPQDIQVGNPNLKVKEVQIYELGYEQHVGGQNYQANFYYRNANHDFAQTLVDLGGGLFRSTIANFGISRAAGADFNANGKLTSKLSYSLSLSPYVNWTDTSNLAIALGHHEVGGVSGRANLNWQVRPDDMVQLNAIESGRRLATQGESEPAFTLNMGWRHTINPRLTATVTAQDLLAGSRFQLHADTPILFQRLDVRPVNRAVFFRLDYRFGGGAAKAAKEPGFEYENGGPAPGPG